MTDCIIVGGGLIGMFTARGLHAAGASVLLLERGEVARESSWAGGGILASLYPWRLPAPVDELIRWSQVRYPAIVQELQAETGMDPEWAQCGMLMLGVADDAAAAAWAGRCGVTVEMIHGEQIRQVEPGLCGGEDQALWLPAVAQVRTPRLCKAMQAGLLQSGVAIREHCEVLGIRQGHGQVQGVDTGSGFMPARTVVIAGGAWSAGLLESLGITIPVRPIRGQMLLIRCRPGELQRIVLRDSRYLIPRRDGRVLVGSTVEDVGFDKGVTEVARTELHQVALELAPKLESGHIEQQWAGLRPGTPTEVPIIGPCPGVDGLWLNTGHSRNGVVMAPASGRILVDNLLGRQSFTDFGPFALPCHVDPGLNVV